jgi:hypothetical protein
LEEPDVIQFSGSELPKWVPRPQITLHIGLVVDRPGGCELTFEAVPEAPLVAKYGSAIAAIEGCREMIVRELDALIQNFADERA